MRKYSPEHPAERLGCRIAKLPPEQRITVARFIKRLPPTSKVRRGYALGMREVLK